MLPPVGWAGWEWRFLRAVGTALLLKAPAVFAAHAVAALAQPVLTVYESKVAVGDAGRHFRQRLRPPISTPNPPSPTAWTAPAVRHWSRVIPFACSTRDAAIAEHPKDGWQLHYTAGGRRPRYRSRSRHPRWLPHPCPAGMVPRLLLVSDGNENLGSAARRHLAGAATWHIPIDTMALCPVYRPKPGLLLESVSIPWQVFSGERFPVEVTLESPASAEASVELTAEGKPIGGSHVQLAEGSNRLRLQASVNSVGAIALAGKISAGLLGDARFEDAVTLRRPRVLFISHDPPDSELHLRRVLEANQFEIDTAPDGVPAKLDPYQLVVVNNWNAESVSAERKAAVEDYVKRGGGLAWIAGEHNVYTDKKQQDVDPLERTLPAKLAPPRSQEGTAVVIIIDKSSSMEGRKIELARLAAIGVVENLRDIDTVGVLIFDNSFQWAVTLRKADDRNAIKRLISGITPDGGTQIAPALTEAYQKILPVNAVYKHIVLLTDGISEEGDSMTLTKEAVANRVTISTVGLGQDVNRAFLEKVASSAEGKSYFLNEPAGLEQILLHDVQEHTGVTAVEKSIQPKVMKQAEILDGVGIESAPALHGYVRYTANPTSDTILAADHDDPLLVRWQYGLGRAAVFTSDAKNRWAVNWISWPGYDKLWANIFRDLLPHAPQSETTADFDRASGELVVDYRLSRSIDDPAAVPDIFVLGPDGFQAPLKIGKVAAGHYRGKVIIGQAQGLFRVRPVADSRAFPEVGFYRQEDEMREYGSNEELLKQIAAATGGRFNPAPQQVFDASGHSIRTSMQLWPGLLALALLLNLSELILRKWKGLLEALHLRRTAEAV